MTKPSSILCLSAASLAAFLLASGCGSDQCEDTDSCGDFPQAGASSAGKSGAGNTGGHATSGSAGSSAGSSANGGKGGSGGTGAGAAGESGQSGASGEAGSGHGGTGGESGQSGAGAGAGGSDACDGSCAGSTPVCNADTADCVECTKSAQCGNAAPICDTSTDTCVECSADDFSACTGDTPVCDTSASQCVACLDSNDCSSASAALCVNSACVACTASDDCTHLDGKAICDAGTCVACTPDDESACGANACNPATHQCTNTPRGSVGSCEPCLADSECTGGDQSDPDARCVPMNFMGTARDGGFCLTRVTAGCTRPYEVVITTASLSGASSEGYCGIDQTVTRCEAVLDLFHSRACPDGLDTSCGCARDTDGNCTELGSGGLCETVGPDANQCTYACDADNRCLSSLSCGGTSPQFCQ